MHIDQEQIETHLTPIYTYTQTSHEQTIKASFYLRGVHVRIRVLSHVGVSLSHCGCVRCVVVCEFICVASLLSVCVCCVLFFAPHLLDRLKKRRKDGKS